MPVAVWVGIATYLAILVFMYAAQRSFLYFPPAERPELEASLIEGLEEVDVNGSGGVGLVHWYRPAQPGKATLVFFHGNAGDLETSAEKLSPLAGEGHGLVLATYRGYAGAGGRPSEQALYEDARRLLAHLEKTRGLRRSELVLYGESLGTGVATKIAAESGCAGLILEAPFVSIAALAQRKYWYLPAYWLVKDRFDSLSRIARIDAPILILHGERDRVVPVSHGRRLAAAGGANTRLFISSEATHTDIFDFGGEQEVRDFLLAIDRKLAERETPAGQDQPPES